MRLSELAFACFLYAKFSNFDDSYLSFLKATNHQPDFINPGHRKALLTWLNQLGCRQFTAEHHELASSEILAWDNQFNSILFERDKNLWELKEAEIYSAARAYEALSNKTASLRKRKGNTFPVSVGPTGAAKILFAIRRNALVPWDDSVRYHYGYDGSAASYVTYLCRVKSILEELEVACKRNGFTLLQLPHRLGRGTSTVPKLIDEYHWVTVTRGWLPPTEDIFKKWPQWSEIG